MTSYGYKTGNEYKELFENSLEAVFHFTLDGNLIAINPAMARIFGYESPQEMIDSISNISTQLYVDEKDGEKFFHELIAKGNTDEFEAQNYHKDKSIIWTRTTAHSVKDGAGQILFFEGFLSDITHQKQTEYALKESEERFRSLVEMLPEAVVIHSDGRLVFANKTAAELVGAKTVDEILGKPILDFVYPDDRELVMNRIKLASYTGEILPPADEKLIRLDDTIIDVEVRSQPIIFQGKPAFQVFVRDISKRKKSETALKRQLLELSTLHNISSAGAVSTDIDTIIQQATQTIQAALDVDNCGILLLSEDGNSLKPHPSYWNSSKEQIEHLDTDLPISLGISGKVVVTGRPVRTGDVRQESDYYKVGENVNSELCVPIIAGGNIIGVLNAESVHRNAFSIADERFFNTIAGNLGLAIERIRLFNTEKQRRFEAELLREATTAMTTSLELDKLLNTVLDFLEKFVMFDNASISLDQDGEMEIVVGRGFPQGIDVIGQRLLMDERWEQLGVLRQPLIYSDAQQDPVFIKWEGTEYIHGCMVVPLIAHDKPIGFINLGSRTTGAFSEKDADFVQTFANSAAVAIENAYHFEVEQENRKQAEILREATTALNMFLNLDEIYQTVLDWLYKLIHYDSASIIIFDQGISEFVAVRGLAADQIQIGSRHEYNPKAWGDQDSFREPIIVSDVENDKRFDKIPGSEHIRGWMRVPLIVQDKAIGAINLNSKTLDAYTKKDADIVQTFANSVAVAIENSRLYQNALKDIEQRRVLHRVSQVMARQIEDPQKTYQALHDAVRELMACDAFAITLYNSDKDTYTAVYIEEAGESFHPKTLSNNSFAAQVISSGLTKIQNVENKEPNPDNILINGVQKVRSVIGTPLRTRDKIVGMITSQSYQPDAYLEESRILLEMIASQGGIALENARLFEAEQTRYRESETLRQASLTINTSLDVENVLNAILIVMKQVVPYNSAGVLLQENEYLQIAATQGSTISSQGSPLEIPVDDNLFQEIVKKEQPVILSHAQDDERFSSWEVTQNVKSWLGVPLMVRGKVIGCITIEHQEENAYDTRYAMLAQAFANQAAIAIANARQFELEQLHRQESETLRQAAETITSTLEIDDVLWVILNAIQRVVPYDSAGIFLMEDPKHVRLTAAKGLHYNEVINKLFPTNNLLSQEILSTRQPLILDNVQEDNRFEIWASSDKVRSWMGIPLSVRDSVIGYITLDNFKIGAYKSHHATLAMTFAHQAAIAIENARLFSRSETQVRRLTALRDIDNTISSSFDLRITLDILIRHTRIEMGTDAAAILLYDSSDQSITYNANTGFNIQIAQSKLNLSESLAGQVILKRQLLHIVDLDKNSSSVLRTLIKGERFSDYIGIPLIGKGQIKGVLELYNRTPVDLNNDLTDFLHTLAGQAAIAIDNYELFRNLQRSNQDLSIAYNTTLEGWGKALELRDKETQGHTKRVIETSKKLARRIGIEGEMLTHMLRGVMLHDIGKMGIPDKILNKKGPLSEEEWKIMRQHPNYAYDLLYPIPYLRPALTVPYSHHERWDGSGYPLGLKGNAIPLEGRIFAVIDIWDALLNDRPYREGWPEEEVLEYLKNEAGKTLDPEIVVEFLAMIREEKMAG